MVHAAEPNAAQAYLAHLRGLGGGPDLPRAPHPVRPVAPTPAPRRPAAAPLSRANWERITVDTNLELHVRRPLSVAENRRLDKLLEAIEAIYGLQP